MAAKRNYRACTNDQGDKYLCDARALLSQYTTLPAAIDREVVIHALTKPDDIVVCRRASVLYGHNFGRKTIYIPVPYFVDGGVVAEFQFKFEVHTGTFRLPNYADETIVSERNPYYADFRVAADQQVHAYLNVVGVYTAIKDTLRQCGGSVARARLPDFAAFCPGDAARDVSVPEPLMRWADISAAAKLMQARDALTPDDASAVLTLKHTYTDNIVGG